MTDERTTDDEWILIPVQRRYLSVANAAIHEAWVEDSAGGSASTPGAARRGWTKTEIDKLKKAIQNHTVRALLDLTADNPGEWVTYDELCKAVGRDWAAVRGDLAGFSKLLNKKFNRVEGKTKWPVEVELQTRDTPTRYRMPLNLARWWNEAHSRALTDR